MASVLADAVVHMILTDPAYSGQTLLERAVSVTADLDSGRTACTDAFTALHMAAKGDVEAMRFLADQAIRQVLAEQEAAPLITLHEGAMFARMAAAVSDDPLDHILVALILAMTANLDPDDVTAYAAEMIARLELVAEGDSPLSEQMAQLVASKLGRELAETMALAKEYRARLLAAKEMN